MARQEFQAVASLNAKDKDRLQRSVEGRNSQQGYILGTKAEFKSLISAGFVEANDEIKGDGGTVAMRASDAGLAVFNASQGGGAQSGSLAGAVATGAAFKITKGIDIPAVRRRAGETGSKYPFDSLEVGDSFHVPPSDDMPNPSKSLASSVTAANQRFATKTEGQHKTRRGTMKDNYTLTRQFQVRAVDATDPEGVGARIWRTK